MAEIFGHIDHYKLEKFTPHKQYLRKFSAYQYLNKRGCLGVIKKIYSTSNRKMRINVKLYVVMIQRATEGICKN